MILFFTCYFYLLFNQITIILIVTFKNIKEISIFRGQFSKYGGINISHKYGIYQSTTKSCIFYKQDEDGSQSTFNVFVLSESDKGEKKVFAFVDNEQMKKESWFETKKELSVKDVIEAFGGWASDAPFVFELEAKKSMNNCLKSVLE